MFLYVFALYVKLCIIPLIFNLHYTVQKVGVSKTLNSLKEHLQGQL